MDSAQKKLAEELLVGHEKLPSFAKQLYFGRFESHRVLPFPWIDAKEQRHLDTLMIDLRTFLDEKVNPDVIDRNATISSDIILGLGKLGILGMTIPKIHGGIEMSQHAYCRAMEEIGGRCASISVFVNVHQSVGLKALTLYGTPEQQKTWLPKLATGEIIAAFSLTEPNAGSDAGGVETTATYDAARKVYRLNGVKQWTTNGSIAGMLTLMARTEDGKITAFLVSPDMPGFIVRIAALEKVGARGTKTANLKFENMEVPEANILGKKGDGLKVALTVLNYGRTTFGAICLGAAKYCLAKAIEHANRRKQFKRELAGFPLIKEKIARIAAYVTAMEAATYMTAGLLDKGQDDIMIESAMLKVFNSEALWWIVYETMQIYGGRSFFTDLPFERMMRDARINMVVEGANEVMHAFIGAVGLRAVGMTLKDAGFVGAARQLLEHLKSPRIGLQRPELATEERELAKRVHKFGWLVPRLLAKYKEDIVEQQMVLDRVAMAATHLYAASAVLCMLERQQTSAQDLSRGKHFCVLAFDEFDRNVASIKHNSDAQMEALSDMLCV